MLSILMLSISLLLILKINIELLKKYPSLIKNRNFNFHFVHSNSERNLQVLQHFLCKPFYSNILEISINQSQLDNPEYSHISEFHNHSWKLLPSHYTPISSFPMDFNSVEYFRKICIHVYKLTFFELVSRLLVNRKFNFVKIFNQKSVVSIQSALWRNPWTKNLCVYSAPIGYYLWKIRV